MWLVVYTIEKKLIEHQRNQILLTKWPIEHPNQKRNLTLILLTWRIW